MRHQKLSLIKGGQEPLLVVALDDDLGGAQQLIEWERTNTFARDGRLLTGILFGNLDLIPATSCFRVAARTTQTERYVSGKLWRVRERARPYQSSSSV